MGIFQLKTFPYLFVIGISLFQILGRIGLFSSTFIAWAINFTLLAYIYWFYKHHFHVHNEKDYLLIKIFFAWVVIGIIRGIFIADNYWEYKSLVSGIFCLSLPAFAFIFQSPIMLQRTLRLWLRLIIPIFLLIVMWIIAIDGYHFYISPVLLLGCFLPIIPKEWKYLFIILLLIMLLGSLGSRAQMLKAAAVLLIAFSVWIRKRVPLKILQVVHYAFYILPIVLLALGISGKFNVFKANQESNEGKYIQTEVVNGEVQMVDVSADTRTFIYEEVISSAVRHNYVVWGRSPARGNDSAFFGAMTAEELGTGKYERFMNEVCHPNVFTWLGLIGLIPWCLIYFTSSYLAINKSNNIYMRYVGIFIAFRFFLGWIEDVNNFNISGISVWIPIAMGLSEKFRSMDNQTFRQWLTACFPFKRL